MTRVLLFPSAYAPAVGGVEQLTNRLAVGLTSVGNTVEVWTIRHPASLAPAEIIDGIQVRRFATPLPRMSVRGLIRLPLSSGVALWRLWRAASRFRPDVIHVQCFSANGIYAMALGKLLRVPVVVTLQGETVMDDNDIYERSSSLRLGLRAALRRCAAVTACSSFVLDDAKARFGLPGAKGTVVPNGVDLESGVSPVPLTLPFSRYVVALGRVVPKKGFDLLLDAFAEVAATNGDVGLVIGGDGEARAGLLDQAHRLGIEDRVVFPGVLSRGQVAWAMANATVFVLPSRVEPFGIVVLEALRGGRAVVVTNRGGADEIVRDGEEGLVVDPTDRTALGTAISRLLSDDDLRTQLAHAGLARSRDFSWDRIVSQYGDIYRGVG